MKVYIASIGQYDDGRKTIAVCSTRELAEKAIVHATTGNCDSWDRGEKGDIEGWVVDGASDFLELGLRRWRVHLYKTESTACLAEGTAIDEYAEPFRYIDKDGDQKGLRVVCWARDYDHAIKIASEKMAELVEAKQ